MHARLVIKVKPLAVSLVLAVASAQAGGAQEHLDKAEKAIKVSLVADKAQSLVRTSTAQQRSRGAVHLAELSAPAQFGYDPRVLADEALEPIPVALPALLYSAGKGGAAGGSRSAVVARAALAGETSAGRGERVSGEGGASLPEPGNWAMIFAGLLGVCAIARRRMSA